GSMVAVGKRRQLPVSALLTAMDQPLGAAVGNSLEVTEALQCLRGEGPPDLRDVTLQLAAEMAVVGGLVEGVDEGLLAAERALDGGGAMERFGRLVSAQGGPTSVNDQGWGPAAPHVAEVLADDAGTVTLVEPRGLGYGLIQLGGGRTRQDQAIDPRVGFELRVKVGDLVEKGQPLAVVHAADEETHQLGVEAVHGAIRIADSDSLRAPGAANPLPLVVDRIS
ncbi:MAG: thymidine phosphorylase, partial [Longimicrobiales bacterium]